MSEVKQSKIEIKKMTKTAVVTALLCVLAPFSVPIPISPVPLSLANFVLFLSIFLLEWNWATIASLLYLLIGLVGLPVFSGFSGGPGKLLGPTGGYLIGYVPLVLIAGLVITVYKLFGRERHHFWGIYYICGILLGEVVLYCMGTIWLSYAMNVTIAEALAMAVIPYIPGDIIKIIAAMAIGAQLRRIPNLTAF